MQRKEIKPRRKFLAVEMPLGTICEVIEEPEPWDYDAEGEADKEACAWERNQCVSGKTENGPKSI